MIEEPSDEFLVNGNPSVLEATPQKLNVNDMLAQLIALRGSDLHLSAGAPPGVRVDGELLRLGDYPLLTPENIREMIYGILTQKQRERFEENLELDASYSLTGVGRFRLNVLRQRSSLGAVLRHIPFEISSIEKLGLPPIVNSFADYPRGLVLVTGPTGSGKSTTLAAVLDRVNINRACHVVTIEDPIEFVHSHKAAIVDQREVGSDTKSFAEALKHVLRQDPDVILVGELRDLETISAAITAAETGHLVLASLHTQDAPQAVDRMIDVFPPHQQHQVRIQLASSLQAIVTQQLIRVDSGRGRVAALEVLIATGAVRNLVREGKTHQLYSVMQSGAQYGMQTMDSALAELVRSRKISLKEALLASSNPEELRRLSGARS